MEASEQPSVRGELRQLLRIARFEAWEVDRLEDEIDGLFRRGVTTQPAPTPDQLVPPAPTA